MIHIREGPARAEPAKDAFQALGAEVKAFDRLMGRYDTMCLVETPDDATMARAALALGALGNGQTDTLRAFTEAESRQSVAALPYASTTCGDVPDLMSGT